ncbi:MAG: aldolase/citrate lyase family protein [Desulfobacterales bacterium]|nr:aldolase/citrate lyase family protein [Desulfobacterales bacterium]
MKSLTKEMTRILKDLKKTHGITAIEASFETEDIQLFEQLRIVELAARAGVGIVVKLGGGEALTDIRLAKMLGATAILGPMIESRFALEKYLELCERTFAPEEDVKYLINIETVDGCRRIEEITSTYNVKMLDTVVLGRTDLCNSMNIKDVNAPQVLEMARALFATLRQRSIRCMVGGGVTPATAPFLQRLEGMVDGFETLKVVFGDYGKAALNLEEGIQRAFDYELKWYQLKRQYYEERCREDAKKISCLSS